MSMSRVLAKVAAIVSGIALAALTWIVILPWDLSEVDQDGILLEKGGDDHGGGIAVVAAVVVLVGLALTIRSSTRRYGSALAAGGLSSWAALFAWRVGSARVSGANFYLIPLVVMVIPFAIGTSLVLWGVAHWLDMRVATGPRPGP